MKKVYTNDGYCLGNEWICLQGLQQSTKEAVMQLVYLDETVAFLIKSQKEEEKDNH